MDKRSVLAFLLLAAPLSGCENYTKGMDVAPDTIGLTDALLQLHDSLVAVHEKAVSTGQYAGLNTCTATAVFVLSAKATRDNKLAVNLGLSGAMVAPVTAGAQGGVDNALELNRANTLTINFASPICNPGGTLGTLRPLDTGLLVANSDQPAETTMHTPIRQNGRHAAKPAAGHKSGNASNQSADGHAHQTGQSTLGNPPNPAPSTK